MRLAMIENLRHSEGYVHQKGIFPAREAVVMQQQERGVRGVTADEVFIGNGVSELIDLSLRALLNPGDEVLVPSPDYPLWTAAVNLKRRARGALPLPCRASLRSGSRGNRSADHQAHARDRRRQSEQSDRRGLPRARRWRRSRASPRNIGWWCCPTRSTIRFSTTAPSSCRWRPWCTTRCAAR
jgi:hypothetical protein